MSELEKNAVVGDPSNACEKVSHLFLRNVGAYVCELDIEVFRDGQQIHIEGSGDNLCVGQSDEIDVGKYGVKEGETFTAYADIKAGKDRIGDKWVVYDPNANKRANFEAIGTTFINGACKFMGTTNI